MSAAPHIEPLWSQPSARSTPTVVPPDPEPGFADRMVQLLPELRRRARFLAGRSIEFHDDLVQETCRRALGARGRFLPGSDLRAWLFCIMRNIHRDRLRSSTREILVGGDWANVPTTPVESRPAWLDTSDEDLQSAVVTLTPLHREVFHLYAVESLRYTEIARQLGIPVNTVATRLRRARLQIRRALERSATPAVRRGRRAGG
jgi:RNA polymerase sigma-70 factor (ECF subfamily)